MNRLAAIIAEYMNTDVESMEKTTIYEVQ